MKFLLIHSLLLSLSFSLSAQLKLDVEGDAKISGQLQVGENLNNIIIGHNAGPNTTANWNTFMGTSSGEANTTGGQNTFYGNNSGNSNIDRCCNTFVGYFAGYNSNATGNTFVGRDAGLSNTGGLWNTYVGDVAGRSSTGSYNTFIGKSAGNDNSSGIRNTFIGYESGNLNNGTPFNNSIAIGHESKVACSNCAVIGGTGANVVKVGIGTETPIRTLDVRGELFVKEEDGVAFFQSTTNNSFISLENNNGVAAGTNVGYFDDGSDKYFYIDMPGGSFGEMIVDATGSVGIGDLSPDAKLDVVGSIHYTGSLTDVSDIRLKENIIPIDNSIDKISRLNGFVYNLIGETNRSAGVSAQQVENVLPEAVSEIGDGYFGVDYTQLVPLLIEGIKEQQSEIIALKHEMSEIRKLLKSQAGRSESEE